MSDDQFVIVERSARFSDDRVYRYTLTRKWANGPAVAFIGLNPSTADETIDDPTIRRCIAFAKRWGYGKLVMLNVYALRATNPRALFAHPQPQGEMIPLPFDRRQTVDRNLAELGLACWPLDRVVCAWGATQGPQLDRPRVLLDRLNAQGATTMALALTASGQPRRPLYVRSDVEPISYPPTEGE